MTEHSITTEPRKWRYVELNEIHNLKRQLASRGEANSFLQRPCKQGNLWEHTCSSRLHQHHQLNIRGLPWLSHLIPLHLLRLGLRMTGYTMKPLGDSVRPRGPCLLKPVFPILSWCFVALMNAVRSLESQWIRQNPEKLILFPIGIVYVVTNTVNLMIYSITGRQTFVFICEGFSTLGALKWKASKLQAAPFLGLETWTGYKTESKLRTSILHSFLPDCGCYAVCRLPQVPASLPSPPW